MTTEDLNQIREVVREEISAVEIRLREEISAVEIRLREEIRAVEIRLREEIRAVETRLREEIAALEKRMIERQDRAVEALTINLSELRTELSQRIERLEKRIDPVSSAVFGLESQMAGVGRTLDSLLKASVEDSGTLAGFKRAFDALEARVRALEEKLSGQGPRPQ
jgi:chromosome segregation ATPase